jgi:hypothetical protein
MILLESLESLKFPEYATDINYTVIYFFSKLSRVIEDSNLETHSQSE